MFLGLFCGLFVFVFVFSHEGARFPLNIFLSAVKKPRLEGHQTSVFRLQTRTSWTQLFLSLCGHFDKCELGVGKGMASAKALGSLTQRRAGKPLKTFSKAWDNHLCALTTQVEEGQLWIRASVTERHVFY